MLPKLSVGLVFLSVFTVLVWSAYAVPGPAPSMPIFRRTGLTLCAFTGREAMPEEILRQQTYGQRRGKFIVLIPQLIQLLPRVSD